ncbi:hypothetical protein ES703_75888 [subsurface metagenome]
MNYVGRLTFFRVKLQGVNYRIVNQTIGGCYINCLQETIIAIPRISYGVNIAGDRDYVGYKTFQSIKLQGIDYRIGNIAIGEYFNCRQETVIILAGISYGVYFTRDIDYAWGLTFFRVKLQDVSGVIGNLTVGGYLDRLQETIITVPRISYGVNIAIDGDYVGCKTF